VFYSRPINRRRSFTIVEVLSLFVLCRRGGFHGLFSFPARLRRPLPLLSFAIALSSLFPGERELSGRFCLLCIRSLLPFPGRRRASCFPLAPPVGLGWKLPFFLAPEPPSFDTRSESFFLWPIVEEKFLCAHCPQQSLGAPSPSRTRGLSPLGPCIRLVVCCKREFSCRLPLFLSGSLSFASERTLLPRTRRCPSFSWRLWSEDVLPSARFLFCQRVLDFPFRSLVFRPRTPPLSLFLMIKDVVIVSRFFFHLSSSESMADRPLPPSPSLPGWRLFFFFVHQKAKDLSPLVEKILLVFFFFLSCRGEDREKPSLSFSCRNAERLFCFPLSLS